MQPALERQIRTRLKRRGVRYTSGRHLLVEALADADGPRSAAELLIDLDRSVPLSSIYRSLTVLERAEVLKPHLGARGVSRYELAEWLSGHHHHLMCTTCGAVDDIHLFVEAEAALEVLVAAIGAQTTFAPTSHSLDIEGRCSRCA